MDRFDQISTVKRVPEFGALKWFWDSPATSADHWETWLEHVTRQVGKWFSRMGSERQENRDWVGATSSVIKAAHQGERILFNGNPSWTGAGMDWSWIRRKPSLPWKKNQRQIRDTEWVFGNYSDHRQRLHLVRYDKRNLHNSGYERQQMSGSWF